MRRERSGFILITVLGIVGVILGALLILAVRGMIARLRESA